MAKILLIDKDRASRQILEHALKLYDYEVVSTHRGDKGLSLAVEEAPDLIVMDIDAQGINGWQAIKILKESSPTWLIPVIALAQPTVTGQLLIQTGFDTYVRKPAAARHILQRIETLLDKVSKELTGSSRNTSAASTSQMGPGETSYVQSQIGQVTVVYVDNSAADSQAVGDIVQAAGYSYANISDSLQALSLLMDLRPQIIFLELVLPVANGYELCAQIRRISFFQNTPIIIVTNKNRISERFRAKMVGASDFLSKPIKAKSVLEILIKHLSHQSTV